MEEARPHIVTLVPTYNERENAVPMLEALDGVAAACGFGTAETMRRAFLRVLRVNPAEYRGRFRKSA